MTAFFGIPGFPLGRSFFGPAQKSGVALVGLPWTNRGNVSGAIPLAALATRQDTGVTIGIDNNGLAYLSSDGGHTWANVANIPTQTGLTPNSTIGNLQFGNGVWVWCINDQNVAISSNNGTTWTGVATTNQLPVGATRLSVTDGAGNWQTMPVTVTGAAGSRQTNNSTTNASTWASSNNFGNHLCTAARWDGTQAVAVGSDSTFTNFFLGHRTGLPGVFTFVTPTNPLGDIWWTGAVYLAASASSTGVAIASTITALATASIISVPVSTFTLTQIGNGGLYFVFGKNGSVANNDQNGGQTFIAGTFNSGGQQLGSSFAATYDSVHNSFICGLANGNVVTFP